MSSSPTSFSTWPRAFLFLLLVWFAAAALHAQTAWTAHPDTPSNLPSNAKFKYAKNAFRLVWGSDSTYAADLSAVPHIPTPFSLVFSTFPERKVRP